MDNTPISKEDILKNFGGVEANSLEKIINSIDIENEIDTIKHSPYYTMDKLPTDIKMNDTNLVIISLNAQSLKSKFSSFEAMLHMLNDQGSQPDILLLQETWVKEDACPPYLNLAGYEAITQGYRCTSHGGLITYVKSNLNATRLHICPNSNIWEGLFVKVDNPENKSMPSIIIGNIYKPPHNNNNRENVEQFISEIEPVLTQLNKTNTEVIIGGDWNLNILKINENNAFSDFLDAMFNNSFYPKITMPTRFATHSATLLDNFYCKFSDCSLNASAGILISRVSDHLPYFLCLNNFSKQKKVNSKFVKCKINKPEAISAFINGLNDADIYSQLDHSLESGPDQNYEKLLDTITSLKNKHLPYRFVKFNKHKHKDSKWITYSIIKSIKTRDMMYHKLKCMSSNTLEYIALKQNLNIYNGLLKKNDQGSKNNVLSQNL